MAGVARIRPLFAPSVARAQMAVSSTQHRNSGTIWYPDAKFERDFKVGRCCYRLISMSFAKYG